jgi:hypothetical protein
MLVHPAIPDTLARTVPEGNGFGTILLLKSKRVQNRGGEQCAPWVKSCRTAASTNNDYHVLMTIRDGKICEVKECLDTQRVVATWFQP